MRSIALICVSSIVVLCPALVGQGQSVTPVTSPLLHNRAEPRWSPFAQIYTPGVGRQGNPALDIDDAGIRHVAYAGNEHTVNGVYYLSSSNGIQWNTTVRIPGSEDVGFLTRAQLATAPYGSAVGGRAYIAWVGVGGFRVTYTDDRGLSFAPPVNVDITLPAAFDMEMTVDSMGALHMCWYSTPPSGVPTIYYARSLPPGMSFSGPELVFLPGQNVWEFVGTSPNSKPYLGIDQAGFVTLSWGAQDGIRLTMSYQGMAFPDPLFLPMVRPLYVQAAIAPDGTTTLVFTMDLNSVPHVFTMVSIDGVNFESPLDQTTRSGVAGLSKSVRVGPNGLVRVAWHQWWRGHGGYNNLTYAESYDYGRTFPRRDFVVDAIQTPSANPTLAIAPDGTKCILVEALTYSQSDH